MASSLKLRQCVFALLFALGAALSRATLQAAAPRPSDVKSGRDHRRDRLVARLYVCVLYAACSFYYVSLPLVVVSTWGVVAALLSMPRFPACHSTWHTSRI
jgi:hypothetical protein